MKDGAEVVSGGSDSEGEEIKVEWDGAKYQDEIAEAQGIRIRRRPSTGPPQHAVGPFEFRLQNAGNTPRNILEEIIWNTDVEVSQVCSPLSIRITNSYVFIYLNLWEEIICNGVYNVLFFR